MTAVVHLVEFTLATGVLIGAVVLGALSLIRRSRRRDN